MELMRFQRIKRLTILTAKSFMEDLCLQKAAALSYATLLALVPGTALLVIYFQMVGKLDAFSDSVNQLIVNVFVAEAAQNTSTYLNKLLSSLHTKSFGFLGFLALILSMYFTLRTVERSMNDIWKIRKHRSILGRFTILIYTFLLAP